MAGTTGAVLLLLGAGLLLDQRFHPVHAAVPRRTPSASAAEPASPEPASAGPASASPDPASPSPSPVASCVAGVDTVLSVPDGTAPDGRRSIWVHRPAGPDRPSIPVLYLLHGYPADPAQLADGSLPHLLDQQMCRSGRPFVVAVPDGRADDLDTEWGDDAAGRFAIETFVTNTAIGLVETDLRRAAGLRAIGGFSMGGYGAATLALRHPDEYRQIAAFGGYYHPDDPDEVFADDSAHAPDRLVGHGTGQRYFLVEGTDEDTQLLDGSIRGEADRFAALLRAAGITVSVAHPPGGHGNDAWYPQLGPMADFLDAGWVGG